MEQPIHPIALEKVLFTKSVVIAIPDHTPDGGPLSIAPENKIDVAAVESKPGHYLVTMHTVMNQSGDPAAPYIIDMECIGLFIADNTLSPEEATSGVTITAHSVLYGAIREAVAWITSRQPHGLLMLGLSILRPKQPDKMD